MNALSEGHRQGSFFSCVALFRSTWGLRTSCCNSLIPWGSTQPDGKRRALSPTDGGRELRLVCVWAAHLFSLLPTYVTQVHRNPPGATHWPLVRFHCLFPFTMIFLCQLLSDIFNYLLSPGSPSSPCWKWLGWENRSVGNGSARNDTNTTSYWETIGCCMLRDREFLSSSVLFR